MGSQIKNNNILGATKFEVHLQKNLNSRQGQDVILQHTFGLKWKHLTSIFVSAKDKEMSDFKVKPHLFLPLPWIVDTPYKRRVPKI